MINKFEIVLRKIHNNLIAAGVMLTNGLTAGDASGYEMYGEKTGDNTFLIHVRKASFVPKNEFGETYEKHSLSELPTNDIRSGQKWTPLVGHISSFLKWLTQLMLRIFAYRSRPHQE